MSLVVVVVVVVLKTFHQVDLVRRTGLVNVSNSLMKVHCQMRMNLLETTLDSVVELSVQGDRQIADFAGACGGVGPQYFLCGD